MDIINSKGVMMISNSVFTAISCLFHGNWAPTGGSSYIASKTLLNIIDCLFYKEFSYIEGFSNILNK